MSFEKFVRTYLNKINPATNMYWRNEQIPGDKALISAYLDFAQSKNLAAVEAGQPPLNDLQLIEAWAVATGQP